MASNNCAGLSTHLLKLSMIVTMIIISVRIAHGHERAGLPVSGVNEDYAVVVPVVDSPPVIDGRLDDRVWQHAPVLDHFWVMRPEVGQPAPYDTKVRVLSTRRRLYIAFECDAPSRESIRAVETRDDANVRADERVEVALDTLHTHDNITMFVVNAAGAKVDLRGWNIHWDGSWQAKVRIEGKRWYAELAIDYSCLTYTANQNTFGVNFYRYIYATQQTTAWACHPDSPRDPRFFPHLTNLPLPRRLAQRQWDVKAFTMLAHEVGKPVSNHQGMDISYPLTPQLSARFVIKPDFSEVEASFERIDVSYVEQFLPERREFFIRESEFFQEISPNLFFSRRIQRFDFGAKLTGALGDYRMGLLSAVDFDTRRHDIALNIVRSFTPNVRGHFGYVDVGWSGFYNRAFNAGWSMNFGGHRRWSCSFSYARSFSNDKAHDGESMGGHMGYFSEYGGMSLRYTYISDHFLPADGYLPRRGFKRCNIFGYRVFRPHKRKKFYRSFSFGGSLSYGVTTDNQFFERSAGGGVRLLLHNDVYVRFHYERSRHLEAHIRPEPFDDRSWNLRIGRHGRQRLRWDLRYTIGRVQDSDLRQWGMGFSWENKRGSWRLRLSYDRRIQDFDTGKHLSVRQWEVSATRILSREQWLALRWVHRSGDFSIRNFALTYRIQRRSGEELYLILGDPQARRTRMRFAIKYIYPIRW